jgi:very-short-patch-repair endonuclease
MLQRVWSGELPRPVCQFPVRCAGRLLRIDFAYPRLLMAIEGDGFGEHGARAGFEGDRERDADLEAMGWVVLRFTWRQVRDRPEWVIERIKQVMAIRTALFFGDGRP